jgi:hypothetical protein
MILKISYDLTKMKYHLSILFNSIIIIAPGYT